MIAALLVCSLVPAPSLTLENAGFRVTLTLRSSGLRAQLDDKVAGRRVADGPLVFRADAAGHEKPTSLNQLTGVRIHRGKGRLDVSGRLAGLDVLHSYILKPRFRTMEEITWLTNRGRRVVDLPDFECGFTIPLTNAHGKLNADLAKDRWMAVPLLHRADDPPGFAHDFSADDLLLKPGSEPYADPGQTGGPQPSRHRWSESWAWLHGNTALGITKFSQESMLFSVLSKFSTPQGALLRFGGTCQMMGEPATIHRIAPGQTAFLGKTRYETTVAGYRGAALAFRAFLDSQGCRFPKDFNPPVHWEQLYDMPGAWDDRAKLYTKAIIEKEAAKGVAYSCEALYLDPGWDTSFASLIWGEKWLGPCAAFVRELRTRYGLAMSLHTPVASWMSSTIPMGPSSVATYPKEAAIVRSPGDDAKSRVPATLDGRRNLALLPGAKASASSLLPGYAIHQIAHLNDGWYGNAQSWIANALPAWAEIDLGRVATISTVRLGNDHLGAFTDRAATDLRVLVAAPNGWHEVASHRGAPLRREMTFSFAPVATPRVRVEILASTHANDMPRLDEIEVYEARRLPASDLRHYARSIRRGPKGIDRSQQMCQASKQYLAVAERRLLKLCADGATFLMFDGNWWTGQCWSRSHGHPVPMRIEDHIQANLDLARRIHAEFPHVLIEMHDMLAGGSTARLTPVYAKYGLPGSYDDNWGFELMWDSMADIKSGRALSLYDYNMGCNVPGYLHVNLKGDNEQCLVLWWYASTCRHLGIGGTSPDPAVVAAQEAAMRRYHRLEAFFKRGEFIGINEQIHLHALDGACVVNAFNLSDRPQRVTGSIALADLGLKPRRSYLTSEPWAKCVDGRLEVAVDLPAWGASVAQVRLRGTR